MVKACPEDELHPLARKVPKVKPCHDVIEMNKKKQERDALVQIIDLCCKDMTLCLPLRGFLDSTIAKKSAAASASSVFPDSYSSFIRLPSYWMAAHLVRVTEGSLSKDLLEGLAKSSPKSIREIFHFAHCTLDSDYWPRKMLDKDLCARVFELRYEECGKRLTGFKEKALQKAGAVNWLAAGPWTLNFEDKKLVTITHISGAEASPESHEVVTPAFQFTDLWSDKLAALKLGTASYTVAAFFKDGEGPHKTILDKKASQLSDIIGRAAQVDSQPLDADPDFGAEAQAEARRKSLLKAREVAQNAKKNKKTTALTLADLCR
jgi:hypothetical protein